MASTAIRVAPRTRLVAVGVCCFGAAILLVLLLPGDGSAGQDKRSLELDASDASAMSGKKKQLPFPQVMDPPRGQAKEPARSPGANAKQQGGHGYKQSAGGAGQGGRPRIRDASEQLGGADLAHHQRDHPSGGNAGKQGFGHQQSANSAGANAAGSEQAGAEADDDDDDDAEQRVGKAQDDANINSTGPNGAYSKEDDEALRAERQPEPSPFKLVFHTTKGRMSVCMCPSWSPNGAQRVYHMARAGFFKDVVMFRTVKNFVSQFGIHGDPEVSRTWRGTDIPDDKVMVSNTKGRLSFAAAGPNTRTSQLFFNLKDNPFLDNMGFSPVGEIVEGLEVLDKLNTEYGEKPSQGRIQREGNAYLDAQFPHLDRILSAELVTDLAPEECCKA